VNCHAVAPGEKGECFFVPTSLDQQSSSMITSSPSVLEQGMIGSASEKL
jgi:hypothetical protein